jgi:hypothetical protein
LFSWRDFDELLFCRCRSLAVLEFGDGSLKKSQGAAEYDWDPDDCEGQEHDREEDGVATAIEADSLQHVPNLPAAFFGVCVTFASVSSWSIFGWRPLTNAYVRGYPEDDVEETGEHVDYAKTEDKSA